VDERLSPAPVQSRTINTERSAMLRFIRNRLLGAGRPVRERKPELKLISSHIVPVQQDPAGRRRGATRTPLHMSRAANRAANKRARKARAVNR
jgi:hypothetical protein